MNTPMLDKLESVKDESQKIGEFIQWFISKYIVIDKKETFENNHIPFGYSSYVNIEELLAKYFDIDLDQVEHEKRLLLDSLQNPSVNRCMCCGEVLNVPNEPYLKVCDKCASQFKF